MRIFRFLLWAVIFLASTFAFTVVFEHGFRDFVGNSKKEVEALKKVFGMEIQRKGDPTKEI